MDDGVERATHSLSIVCLSFRLHIFFLLLLLFLISSAYFFELGKVIFLLRGRLRADYKSGARAIGRVKSGVSHSSSVQSKVQRFFFK